MLKINENTMWKYNLWGIAKVVLSRKFLSLNARVRQEERSEINNPRANIFLKINKQNLIKPEGGWIEEQLESSSISGKNPKWWSCFGEHNGCFL